MDPDPVWECSQKKIETAQSGMQQTYPNKPDSLPSNRGEGQVYGQASEVRFSSCPPSLKSGSHRPYSFLNP